MRTQSTHWWHCDVMIRWLLQLLLLLMYTTCVPRWFVAEQCHGAVLPVTAVRAVVRCLWRCAWRHLDVFHQRLGANWGFVSAVIKAVRVVVAMFCFLVRMVGVKLATLLPKIRQKGKEFDEQVYNLGCTSVSRLISVTWAYLLRQKTATLRHMTPRTRPSTRPMTLTTTMPTQQQLLYVVVSQWRHGLLVGYQP